MRKYKIKMHDNKGSFKIHAISESVCGDVLHTSEHHDHTSAIPTTPPLVCSDMAVCVVGVVDFRFAFSYK